MRPLVALKSIILSKKKLPKAVQNVRTDKLHLASGNFFLVKSFNHHLHGLGSGSIFHFEEIGACCQFADPHFILVSFRPCS